MLIYAADDEPLLLDILCEEILACVPDCTLRRFSRPSRLLAELASGTTTPDVVFLDIEMPGMTGLELAYRIKQQAPHTNIIFVTGYSQYALEALALRPSGYLLKPVTREKIQTELQNLRMPPQRTVSSKPFRVQCFGNYEVFVNDVPLVFSRAKSKELLAYLVDRCGASCTSKELSAVLWEDASYDRAQQKMFSVARAEMLKTLRQAGADITISDLRDTLAIDRQSFDCDYYMALAGDAVALNSFTGEYMAQYSWAEFTLAALINKFRIF